MTTIPVPELDSDKLTYRFPKHLQAGFRTVYAIERSINGGTPHMIGTVEKTREATWHDSPSWVAVSLDETKRGGGTSRAKAVSSLEYATQPDEYRERKEREFREEHDAHRIQLAVKKANDVASLEAVMDAFPEIAERLASARGRAGSFDSAHFSVQQVIDMLNTIEPS